MTYDLLIVSDIHLTDGREPVAGEEHLVPELERFLGQVGHEHTARAVRDRDLRPRSGQRQLRRYAASPKYG